MNLLQRTEAVASDIRKVFHTVNILQAFQLSSQNSLQATQKGDKHALSKLKRVCTGVLQDVLFRIVLYFMDMSPTQYLVLDKSLTKKLFL